MSLGETIRTNRKRLGLTQECLAIQLGVSFQAVSYWERDDKRPGPGNLLRLSELLEIPAAILLRLAAQ